MKFYISIFLLFSLTLQSQEKKIFVNYNVTYNTASPREKSAYLSIVNNNESHFIELPEYRLLNNKNNNENYDENSDAKIIRVNYFPKGVLKNVSVNLESKTLNAIETIIFDKTIYKVTEALPKLNWTINYNETKKIGSYLCNKATTYFRGRNYIVWYSKELPLRFGPWKLNGAPGLILEAYDQTVKYRWVVKKISNNNIAFKSLVEKIKYDKEIGLKDFVNKKYGNKNATKNFDKKLKSRLPRNATVTINKNTKRQGMELIFEWEQETKEN